MVTKIWKGDAQAVSQVETLTVGGTVEIGDIFKVTIGNRTVSVSATTTNLDTTATEIATAVNALSALYEFTGITAAAAGSGGVLTLTCAEPFTCTVATTESNGGAADAQTFGRTTTTSATGPNHWDNAENWEASGVPADGDTVIIPKGSPSILYGLDQSAIQPAELRIEQGFTGTIGLPVYNSNGYEEYREKYLKIGPVLCNIGVGEGSGSGRIKINFGTDQTHVKVYNTGDPLESPLPSVILTGTNASTKFWVTKGRAGWSVLPGETGEILEVKMGNVSNPNSDAWVEIGSGVTGLGNLIKYGGTLTLRAAATKVEQHRGGATYLYANLTTALIYDGLLAPNAELTIGTVIIGNTGIVDCTRDLSPLTFTNMQAYKGATLLDPVGRVTFTNPFAVKCRDSEWNRDLGADFKLQRSY